MGWLLKLLLSWVVLAVAFYLTTRIVTGIHVTGGAVGYLEVALIFGLINAILGPILRFVSLPAIILTFGLFLLLVNGFLLWIVEQVSGTLHIDHFFWDAIFGALVLGIVSWVLNALLHGTEKRAARR
jgi:putative membrane protein